MLKISGIKFPSYVDGHGIRVAVFFSGCHHNCKGCHNELAQKFDFGTDAYDISQIDMIQMSLDRPYCAGLTISGGDPMANAKDISDWLDKIDLGADQDIWLYTGDELDDVINDDDKNELANKCDYIVVGPYVEELRSTTNGYFGSSNQRIWEHSVNGIGEDVWFDVTNLFVTSSI